MTVNIFRLYQFPLEAKVCTQIQKVGNISLKPKYLNIFPLKLQYTHALYLIKTDHNSPNQN